MSQKQNDSKKHQLYASWIFGSVLLIFYLGVFLFFQERLSSDSIQKMLALISALLASFLTYFMKGQISLRLNLSSPVAKIIVEAAGIIATFTLVLWFFTFQAKEANGEQPEKPKLAAYVWAFKKPKDWKDDLANRFKQEFREFLIKEKCLTILERAEIEELIAQISMEKEIRRIQDIPADDLKKLKKGATSVIFGKIDEDQDGGVIKVTVSLQSFDHEMLWEDSIRIMPYEKINHEIRLAKMKELAKKMCIYIKPPPPPKKNISVDLVIPQKMIGAEIFVDNKPAIISNNALKIITIVVEEKAAPHKITLKKGDNPPCEITQLIRGDKIVLTPCQSIYN